MYPGKACEDTAEQDDAPRSVLVDQETLDWGQPRLQQHEHREDHLHRGFGPFEGLLNFGDKQGPGILDVRCGDHADDAKRDLKPTAEIDPPGSVWELVTAVAAKASSGGIAGCSQFGVDLTTAGRIKTMFATYTQPPRPPDRKAGTYSLTDSSCVGDEMIYPNLAWQYDIHDKDFRQIEADGFSMGPIKSKPLSRPF